LVALSRGSPAYSGSSDPTLTLGEIQFSLAPQGSTCPHDDAVDALIMDWDLPATRWFKTLLVLMGAAPQLSVIILGDVPNLLQQMNLVGHGAQGYLLKRRLDADNIDTPTVPS